MTGDDAPRRPADAWAEDTVAPPVQRAHTVTVDQTATLNQPTPWLDRTPLHRHRKEGEGKRRAATWHHRMLRRSVSSGSNTSVDSVRPNMRWLEPIAVIILGGALGIATQQATGTSVFLRVPALIAAMIMVAHGVTSFDPRVDGDGDTEVTISESTEVVRVEQINSSNPGRAVYSGGSAPETKITTTTKSVKQDSRSMAFAMFLSVWLGLATLANPAAPRLLLTLSLVASFLLFSEAYRTSRLQD